MERRIGVGIIGCGMISASHIRGYLELSEKAEILAICDTVEPNAQRRAKDIIAESKKQAQQVAEDAEKAATAEEKEQLKAKYALLEKVWSKRGQNLQRLQRNVEDSRFGRGEHLRPASGSRPRNRRGSKGGKTCLLRETDVEDGDGGQNHVRCMQPGRRETRLPERRHATWWYELRHTKLHYLRETGGRLLWTADGFPRARTSRNRHAQLL